MSTLEEIAAGSRKHGIGNLETIDELRNDNMRYNDNTNNKITQLKNEILVALEQLQESARGGETLSVISAKCLTLAEQGKMQKILHTLHFRAITVREENIHEAHEKTFNWIFKDAATTALPDPKFMEWMRSGSGIYWISGKAGSGKSTLMKYLWRHRDTTKLLQTWAGSSKLVVAIYYLWNAGNALQKSQQGLLRSLLFHTLREFPELIPSVCSSRWLATDLYGAFPNPWTLQELSDTCRRLSLQTITPLKVCFFVDGLDEYDGEHREIVHIVETMASSASIKLCVSSRPWNIFVEAFGDGSYPNLVLQQFTKGDIRRYVTDNLSKHPQFPALQLQDHRYNKLVEDIIEKAQGVFLWVFLVVRSLLRGFTDDNHISVLENRLNGLPAGLEEYFKKMLDTIEDVYQENTARIFQVSVHTTQPLSALALASLEIEETDPHHAVNSSIKDLTEEDVISVSQKMRKHINARCKDLLEVTPSQHNFLQYQVEFLHRTVRDFLKTRDMYDLLRGRTRGGFDPWVSISRMLLYQIKHFPWTKYYLYTMDRRSPQAAQQWLDDFYNMVQELMCYSKKLEDYNGSTSVAILDELDRVISIYASEVAHACNESQSSRGRLDPKSYNSNAFLSIAADAGLQLYVAEKRRRKSRLPLQTKKWLGLSRKRWTQKTRRLP
jgi:hypothetical protein